MDSFLRALEIISTSWPIAAVGIGIAAASVGMAVSRGATRRARIFAEREIELKRAERIASADIDQSRNLPARRQRDDDAC